MTQASSASLFRRIWVADYGIDADRYPRGLRCFRMLALSTTVWTWLLGLIALVVGAVLGHLSGLAADSRRLSADDARRWVHDRRQLYARYLGLIESLHRQADSLACFLPDLPGAPWREPDDEAFLFEESFEWIARWDDDVQPLLGEVELMASQPVADLAARAAHGILAAVPQCQYLALDERRIVPESFENAWPLLKGSRALIDALRNAMREELGIGPITNTAPGDPDWPWLPTDNPSQGSSVRHASEL